MLPPLGSEPQAPLTFMSCMLLPELIPLFAGSLSPLGPYVVMLYWFQKNSKFMVLGVIFFEAKLFTRKLQWRHKFFCRAKNFRPTKNIT